MPRRGIYYLSEPLTNVQFKMKLEYSGPVIGVMPPYVDFTDSASEQTNSATASILVEECTFVWQQKLRLRGNKVRQSPTAPSDAQENQSDEEEMRTDVADSGPERCRIFTLVDGEFPVASRMDNKDKDIASRENKLAERIATSRNRRIEPTTISHRNPVIDLPHKEHQMKARTVQHIKQSMHIMAYLGPNQNNIEAYDETNEYVLCKLTAIDGTNLIVEPDILSTMSTIESRYGIYKTRLYLVKNKEFDEIDDVTSDQHWFGEEANLTMSDLPTEGTTKLIYLIDIERAVNFPHDGLRVEYKIDIPEQCTLIGTSPLRGWSPISYSSPLGKDDVAVFSHPISSAMIVKEKEQFSGNFFWPRIIFRICAEDYWGRFFVDGYGLLNLPTSPGRQQLNVNCWKLSSKGDKKSMLFEHFIAQSIDFKGTELSQITEDAHLGAGLLESKIGLNIASSGTLQLNVQCIMQSRKFVSHQILQEMKYGATMRRVGLHSQIHWKILKVLAEFEEARRNLLKIRNQPIHAAAGKI